MLRLIIDVLVTSGLLYALATALPGVRLKSFGTALIVVLVYGLLNYFLFWLIALIAFIPMLLSFGLFGAGHQRVPAVADRQTDRRLRDRFDSHDLGHGGVADGRKGRAAGDPLRSTVRQEILKVLWLLTPCPS